MKIDNQFDALVLALQLAITAPTEEKSQECIKHAESLTHGFSELEIERAKRKARDTANIN